MQRVRTTPGKSIRDTHNTIAVTAQLQSQFGLATIVFNITGVIGHIHLTSSSSADPKKMKAISARKPSFKQVGVIEQQLDRVLCFGIVEFDDRFGNRFGVYADRIHILRS
jgi:hypothetical protein